MLVPTFNHDWYERDNIYENLIHLAEFPKLNFLIKKHSIQTKCKKMTVFCARMVKTWFLIYYSQDKSKSTPSPITRTPAHSNQFFLLGVRVSGVLLYYLLLRRFLMKLHCGVHSVTTLLTISIFAIPSFDQTENAQNHTQIFKMKIRFSFVLIQRQINLSCVRMRVLMK